MAAVITPIWTQLPPEYGPFQALAEAALNAWAPNSKCALKPLGGGASNAAVFLLDVTPSRSGEHLNGKYILKLSTPPEWADQPFETDAHKRAVGYSEDFAHVHIPVLFDEYPRSGEPASTLGYAMLYGVAGQSLDAFQTADARESSPLLAIAEDIASGLLRAWTDPVLGEAVPPHDLLAKWLAYRLSPQEAAPLHTFTNRLLKASPHFVLDGEALLHPLRFCERLKLSNADHRPLIQGLLHYDLHGGNLLFFARDPEGRPYQIIDFGLSNTGPIGFDQAYLELWCLLRSLGEHHATRLLGVLRKADRPERRENAVKICRMSRCGHSRSLEGYVPESSLGGLSICRSARMT